MLIENSNNSLRVLRLVFATAIGGAAFLAGVVPVAAQKVAVSNQFVPAGEPFVFGSNGGVYKAETEANYLAGPITELRVCAGGRIDSIQVKYGDRWGTKYGGAGGNCRNVEVPSGQTIKNVSVRHGAGVDGFDIWVGNQSYSFGGRGGVEARATPPTSNASLGYIEARAGKFVDQLRLVYAERRTVIDKTALPPNVVVGDATISGNPPAPAPVPRREPTPGNTGQSTNINVAGPAATAIEVKEGDPRPQQYFLDVAADKCADPGNLMLDGWNRPERPILMAAGDKLIFKKGFGYGSPDMSDVVAKLKADPKLRWEFAPLLLEGAWEALTTKNPTPAQVALKTRFEIWAGCDKNLMARRTLSGWNQHMGKSNSGSTIDGIGIEWIDPNPQYKPVDFSLLQEKGPTISGFDVTNDGNPLFIGTKGRIALAKLFYPLKAQQTPELEDIDGLRYIQEDFSDAAIAAGVGGGVIVSGALAATVGVIPVYTNVQVIFREAAQSARIDAKYLKKSGAEIQKAGDAARKSAKVSKRVVKKAIQKAFGRAAAKAGGKAAAKAASFGGGAAVGVVLIVAVAAAEIGQELAEMIQTLLYEEALTFDAQNVSRYDLSAALGPNPGPIETMSVYSLLLKMVIAEPADRNTLTLEMPVLDCPMHLAVVGGVCTANVGFFEQPGLALAEAEKIAKRNGWRLANPQDIELAWSQKTLHQYAFGMMADGKFAVPVQKDLPAIKKGHNIGATGGNQGFFYVPVFFDNTTAAPGGTFIQNAKDMSAYLSVTVGAPFAEMDKIGASWKIVKSGDHVRIQSVKAPALFAHLKNGKLVYGPIDAASAQGHWKVKHADGQFFRIESIAHPHRYIHMENGSVDVGHIEPNWKGSLWHMPGYVE